MPEEELSRDELVRRADSALYWAKEYGKNQVRVYRPDVVEIAELKRLAAGPDRAARFRAAASLAKAVDARDAYTGSHSERVADLAARIATRLGVDREQVELTRLAGSLHDLGKLAIPEEILRKPGPLSETERLVLERHPQIGFRMLESLGVDPVADWVLHHHERWDGSGYPDGVSGDDIPLGARIIFVADAYDAMTSDRVYRGRLPTTRRSPNCPLLGHAVRSGDRGCARRRARHRRRLAGRCRLRVVLYSSDSSRAAVALNDATTGRLRRERVDPPRPPSPPPSAGRPARGRGFRARRASARCPARGSRRSPQVRRGRARSPTDRRPGRPSPAPHQS